MGEEPKDELLEEQENSESESEEDGRQLGRFAQLVFRWLEADQDEGAVEEGIFTEAQICTPDEIREDIAYLTQVTAYQIQRFADAEPRPMLTALEALVAQLPETLAPRRLLHPLRCIVALHAGDVDMLLEFERFSISDSLSRVAHADESSGDTASARDTDSADANLVEFLEALQALRPRLNEALGEARARALELMLAPVLHVSRKILCVDENPWLLETSTAELVEQLVAEAPPVLHEGLTSLRDTLERESGRHPEEVAARRRSQEVLDALRVIVRQKVGEHPGYGLDALFDALDEVDVSPLANDVRYLMSGLKSTVVKTTEDAAFCWLIWRVHKAAEIPEAHRVDVAQVVARRIVRWTTQPAVARRLLDLFIMAFKEAHLLRYHPPVLFAQLHLDTARISHELYRHTHDEGSLKFCYVHAMRAMDLSSQLHEFDLMADARDVYFLAVRQLSGPDFGRAKAIEELRYIVETEPAIAPIITAKTRFRLVQLLMDEATDQRGAPPEEARHLLEQAIQALETESEVPETLSNLYLQLANFHRRAFVAGDTMALQHELEAHERALSIQTDDFVSDQLGAIVANYVQALELSGASPSQCLIHIERTLARLKPGSDDATRGMLLESRAEYKSTLGELTQPVSDWYEPALRDLQEAREAFAVLQIFERLGHILLTELKVHRRAHRLDEAIATYREHFPGLKLEQHPRLELELQCEAVELYLRRNQGRDFRNAKEVMGRILDLASHPDCLLRVAEQVRWFVLQGAGNETPLEMTPLSERIAALLDLLPSDWREALQLALDALRCRMTGDPSPENIVNRFLKRSKGTPGTENFAYINDAFYFALKTLKASHPLSQQASRELEKALLQVMPDRATEAHISCLSDVALMRLQVEPLTLRHVKAAERLLDHADKLRSGLPNLANRTVQALETNRLKARLHLLGLTPGQSDSAILQVARKLLTDSATQPSEVRCYLAVQLCCYLANRHTSDSVPILALVDEIQQTLELEGLALELPPGLLQTLRQRTALRPAGQSDSARAHCLMEEAHALIHSNDQRPLETYPKVQGVLEEALRLLDPTEVQGQLKLAEIRAELELSWHELDKEAGHRTRGMEIAQKALAHAQIDACPVEKAMLLRALARLVSHEHFLNRHPNLEPHHHSVELLEQAWRCDLSGSPQTQFIILLNLGNARRWLYERQENPDHDVILKAAKEYRQALALATATGQVHPQNVATCQKCLAEALRLIGDPASLEEARGLARESLEARVRFQNLVRAAESSLLVTQMELDRAEAGHTGALESARNAVLEGLEFIRPEAAPTVYSELSRLRVEIERQLGASAPIDAEGPARINFAARRHQQALRNTSSNGPKNPHMLAEDESVATDEALMRGHLTGSVLFEPMMRVTEEVLRVMELYENDPSRIDLAAETAQIDHLLDKKEFLAAGWQTLCLLYIAWGPYGIKPDRPHIIGLLKRLLRPGRASSFPWDMACLMYHQAAQFCIHLLNHTGAEDAELAEHWSRRAVELCEVHAPNDFGLAEILTNLGLALYHMPSGNRLEHWKEAQRIFERVLVIARHYQDENMEATALLNLGTVISDLARLDDTVRSYVVPIYERAIAIRRRRGDKRRLVELLSSLGFFLIEGRRPCDAETAHRALALLEEARKILEPLGTRDRSFANVINHLGIAHERMFLSEGNQDELRQSQQYYEEAARLNHALGDRIEEARALHNLGASMIRDPLLDTRVRAASVLFQALSVRQHRITEAWETLTTLWDGLESRRIPELPQSLVPLFIACQERCRAQLEQAGDDLRALEVERRLLCFFAGYGQLKPSEITRALRGRSDEAVERAERLWLRAATVASQLETARFLGDICAMRAWLAAQGGASPLEVLEHTSRGRARTLMLHRVARLRVLSPAAHNQRIELDQSLRKAEGSKDVQQLSDLIRLQERLREVLSEQPNTLEEERDVIPPPIYRSDLEARLRTEPGTALIDITTSDLGTVLTVASLDKTQSLKLETRCLSMRTREILGWLRLAPGSAAPGWLDSLERLGSIAPAQTEAWIGEAERCAVAMEGRLVTLYRELIGRSVAGLNERGVQHLIFSVAGPLCLLPIGAAQYVDSAGRTRYLIEDFESIRLVPSATTFLQSRSDIVTSGRRVLLVATDIVADSSDAQAASHVLAHIKTLATPWQDVGCRLELLGTLLPGASRATPEASHQALERVDIAHLLCHGVFYPTSREKTGLVLEDGLLSSQLLFQRPHPLSAKLVIVSACQSARTQVDDLGGEMPGVAGMLLRSGVDTVVGALWDVSYLASARLMERLHASLATGQTAPVALGLAMRKALAEARQLMLDPEGQEAAHHPMLASLKGEHRIRMARLLASPLFWAGFEVIGVA